MNVETVREFCLSLPLATEDFPFDEETLVFRVLGRIFAMIDLTDTSWFVLKCDPDYALVLRDAHEEIVGAWHMNKRHWNQVNIFGRLPDTLIHSMIRHSYTEVVRKLPKRLKVENQQVLTIAEFAPNEL